ncbi:MAG: hypothetical protein JWR66_2693 [Modestobacter sp.]|jgi:hypothetical protein|nr:hypothetical protein [Modestobacter sp.]
MTDHADERRATTHRSQRGLASLPCYAARYPLGIARARAATGRRGPLGFRHDG